MYSDEPGILTIRTRFDEFTGLYVMHCHRLNHEDNGLMALINVISTVSVYAVAIPGEPGKPAEVRLYDGDGDRFIATIIAFPGYEGGVNACDPRTMRTQIDEAIGRVFDPGTATFSDKIRAVYHALAPYRFHERVGRSLAKGISPPTSRPNGTL